MFWLRAESTGLPVDRQSVKNLIAIEGIVQVDSSTNFKVRRFGFGVERDAFGPKLQCLPMNSSNYPNAHKRISQYRQIQGSARQRVCFTANAGVN